MIKMTENKIKKTKEQRLMNPMREIVIEKVVLNIGVGKEKSNMDKGIKLLKKLTNDRVPIKTTTNKRIQAWSLRPGLAIGVKVTLRNIKSNMELIKNLLDANEYILSKKAFDENGNISFGVKEYITIPGIKYDPELGMMGFQVTIRLKRKAGLRVKLRAKTALKIGNSHRITHEESINYLKKFFDIKIKEELEEEDED